MSSIIESIVSSINSDFTKSETAKAEMLEFLTNIFNRLRNLRIISKVNLRL